MTIDDGRVSAAETGFLLEFDELYDTDIDDLWNAITTPERLSRWMAPYRGEFRLGGRWEAIGSDGGVYCGGWHAYLESLARHLAEPASDLAKGEAWQRRLAELAAAYEERFAAARG